MGFYDGKAALVCGGAGFIGSHVADELRRMGSDVTIVRRPHSGKKAATPDREASGARTIEADLKDLEECRRALKGIDLIFNYASSIGNLEFNRAHADIYRENVMIELNMLEASRASSVEKYLLMSSAFVYPENIGHPLREQDAGMGNVGESKFGYASSKRANEAAASAYARQYGMKIAIVRPSNVYGPRDNFFTGRGLVVPSFIEKIYSGEKSIIVAGDGMQVRNFIYVSDCVEGMLLALEKHANSDPLNIATPQKTTIRELAEKIIRLSGKDVKISYDKNLSTGPKMVVPDCTKATQEIGFEAKVLLEEGLVRTIEWYMQNFCDGGGAK